MPTLAYDRAGSGPTLLLIHGIGSRRQIWDPVLPLLAEERDVVRVDLPGFGESSPLPEGGDVSPGGLADVVAKFCAELDLERPHVAGNSLGGWIALELARTGHAASATGINPAGLWRRAPRYAGTELRINRTMARWLDPIMVPASKIRPLAYALTANLFGRPWRVPAEVLVGEARAMENAPGFDRTLAEFRYNRFTDGQGIDVPVTIAFGRRDVVLGPGCRRRDELPAHTRWLNLPGCGHTPTYDDPELIAKVILEGSRLLSVRKRGAGTASVNGDGE
jgi:pimeloyl-ACP methyl ester carboxylesterase